MDVQGDGVPGDGVDVQGDGVPDGGMDVQGDGVLVVELQGGRQCRRRNRQKASR